MFADASISFAHKSFIVYIVHPAFEVVVVSVCRGALTGASSFDVGPREASV